MLFQDGIFIARYPAEDLCSSVQNLHEIVDLEIDHSLGKIVPKVSRRPGHMNNAVTFVDRRKTEIPDLHVSGPDGAVMGIALRHGLPEFVANHYLDGGINALSSGLRDAILAPMTLIDDWLIYLEKPDAFSKDHFEPMITDTGNPHDLQRAFGSLPQGAALIERIECLRSETEFTGLYHVQDPSRRLGHDALIQRARSYCDCVSDFLRDIGMVDLVKSVNNANFRYLDVRNYDFRDSDGCLGLNETGEILEDEFISVLKNGPHYLMSLFQAVLFMTKIPVVTRYIMRPIADFPLNEVDGYATWIGGAAIAFGDRKNFLLVERELIPR